MKVRNLVFDNFNDYWTLTKYLEEDQRRLIFKHLTQDQQKKIERSYFQGGWEDLFKRNEIDKIIDEIKINYQIDLLEVRTKVFMGKSHFMKKSQLDFILDFLKDFEAKHTQYIFGGIGIEIVDQNTVLLIKEKNGQQEKD